MSQETPLLFKVDGSALLGIIHTPAKPVTTGVLIVVGGPQYRIGAHRQFVHLARSLADQGIAAMRFDYRGIGDAEGLFTGFENISDDIDAAIQAFRDAVPGLQSIVLWGLCDAASAILMKAHYDPVVCGIVALNPWVRTDAGEAKAFIKHYYLKRLLSADLWKKVLTGRFKAGSSLKDISKNVSQAQQNGSDDAALPQRVASGIQTASVPILLILSGNDLVAREFEDAVRQDELLQNTQSTLKIERLAPADHTFSKMSWKKKIAALTQDWVKHIDG